MLPILLDESTAYLVHPAGEVIGLNKTDGSIRWLVNLDREVVAAPFLFKNFVLVPVKAPTGTDWLMLSRSDGKLNEKKPHFEIKQNFEVSQGNNSKDLILTVDNKVMSIDTEAWKIDWTQTLTDPIKGPAIAIEHQIFLTTLGAKMVRIDASKKGKIDWEVDLPKAPASSPSYLPVAHRLSVMCVNGELVTVDAKLGKVLWTTNTENKNSLNDTWSVRLTGKNIEEFKMDWLHKGWTIWSSCAQKKFCMYTPNKGLLIQRVQLGAAPMTLPLQIDKRWLFFGRTKPGEYLISHLLEDAEVKKLKGEVSSSGGG